MNRNAILLILALTLVLRPTETGLNNFAATQQQTALVRHR